MSNTEIKVGQKWVATKDVAFWKKGTTAEITETGACIRFKNSDGQEEFIFNNPEDVVWFKSMYKLVVTDQVNEEMGTVESLRNSILDIRSKREVLQKEILQLDEQEKEAVEKLKELGFVLYEDNVAKELDVKELVATENKAVLYAEDIEEDMTDHGNWKVGDFILCVNGAGWKDWIDEGEVAEMVEELTVGLCLKTKYGVRKFGSSYYEDFRFHSRPVK